MRVGHVDMAKIGGQNGQEPLGILLGFVPAHQRVRRENMPHVMQARTVAVSCAAQADLARQSIERSMNVSHIEAITPTGCEHIRRRRQSCALSFSAFDKILQYCARRCVHGHETGLSELCAADRQHCGIEINVRKLEVPGFAKAQAGNAQQSEQAVVCQRPELAAGISARHLKRGGQKTPDVVL